MDKDEAFAICFLNLKGRRDKDLLATARALQYLKNLPEYGSNKKVGQAVGVSGEIVREFLTLLRFPEPTQSLFATNQLRLDQGRSLWRLATHSHELVAEASQISVGLTAEDTRHLVDYIIRNPGISVSDAKKRIIESKTIIEREFHVVALLSQQNYDLLVKEARERNLPVDELMTLIVQEWLKAGNAP